jgi:hypothetical protein
MIVRRTFAVDRTQLQMRQEIPVTLLENMLAPDPWQKNKADEC